MLELVLDILVALVFIYLAFPSNATVESPTATVEADVETYVTLDELFAEFDAKNANTVSKFGEYIEEISEVISEVEITPCISSNYESEFLGVLSPINAVVNDLTENLKNLSIRQLKAIASTLKLPRYGNMSKLELCLALATLPGVIELI